MSLSPGSRLGPYEVTALIGQGGMGEVYRAHDTKLFYDQLHAIRHDRVESGLADCGAREVDVGLSQDPASRTGTYG